MVAAQAEAKEQALIRESVEELQAFTTLSMRLRT